MRGQSPAGRQRGRKGTLQSVCVCVAGKGWVRNEKPRPGFGQHLWETTVEAGGPATLGAGSATAQALAAQNAVAALGVCAPGQVGAALHIAAQEGFLVLQGHEGQK